MNGRTGAPLVSVGIPVFNGERFLEQTLTAVVAQTHSDFEVVIVDNGSGDRTEEICRRFAERDSRIRYLRSPTNRGASWSFNRVFQLATGELFKWWAHDDLCAPTFLERCLEELGRRPEAVLAYPRCTLIDDAGAVIRDHDDGLDLPWPEPHLRLRHLVRTLGYSHPVYGLIRSEALRRTRLLGAYPTADFVLLAELALLGRFHELPDRLFLRRIHEQMSRAVNPTAHQAASWFDPSRPRRQRTEAWRLCFEFVAAIARSPLAPAEKLRCLGTFADVGGRRYWDHLLRELWLLLTRRA